MSLQLGGLGLALRLTLIREEKPAIANLEHALGLIRPKAREYSSVSGHGNNQVARTKPLPKIYLFRYVKGGTKMKQNQWTWRGEILVIIGPLNHGPLI